MNKTFQTQVKQASKSIHIMLLICIVITAILSHFMIKIIPIMEEITIVSMIFVGAAIFFVELAISNYHSIKTYNKKGLKIPAKVKSCTKETSEDASFYVVELEFEIDGVKLLHELISEKRMSIDKKIDIYYLVEHKCLMTASEYDNCKDSDKTLLMIALGSLGIAAAILIIALISYNSGGILLNKDFWLLGFGLIISIIFIKIGYSMYKPKNTYHGNIIEGKILSYEEVEVKTGTKTKTEYYPTIEYKYNGVTLTYKSQEKTKKFPKGTIVNLNIDEETHSVRIEEFHNYQKNNKRDGIIIMAVGIVTLIIVIMAIFFSKM